MIRLTASGLNRTEVAERMCTAPDTIKSRFDRIRDLTGCRTQAAMVRWAYDEGLLIPLNAEKPVKRLRALLTRSRAENRELRSELVKANQKVAELQAQLRAAHSQLTSVPWRTTTRARV